MKVQSRVPSVRRAPVSAANLPETAGTRHSPYQFATTSVYIQGLRRNNHSIVVRSSTSRHHLDE